MRLAFILALVMASAPAAAAGKFVLVNGTDGPFAGISLRRVGTENWKPLGHAPASAGRYEVALEEPDCAFDLRAEYAGGDPVTWTGVNLCDVKSVTLKRDSAAGPWVDYDVP